MTFIDPFENIQVEQVLLNMRKVGVAREIPKFVIGNAKFDASESFQRIAESLVVSLSSWVLTDQFVSTDQAVELDVPATWWQHLKRDHFPAWFTRRWPVRYQTHSKNFRLEREVGYPNADLILPPERFGQPVIFERVIRGDWRSQ